MRAESLGWSLIERRQARSPEGHESCAGFSEQVHDAINRVVRIDFALFAIRRRRQPRWFSPYPMSKKSKKSTTGRNGRK